MDIPEPVKYQILQQLFRSLSLSEESPCGLTDMHKIFGFQDPNFVPSHEIGNNPVPLCILDRVQQMLLSV